MPEDEERIEIAEQAFRYDHPVKVYGPRWSREWRWPPWERPSSGYTEVRVPDPSITYGVGLALGAAEPPWSGSVKDFYGQALLACRALTAPVGFIYAVSGYDAYRFWPHRADPHAQWMLGCPGAREWDYFWDTRVVPPDFSWVLNATQLSDAGRPTQERITLSGEALLAAFERYRPKLFSAPIVEEARSPITYEELKASEREMDAMMKGVLKEARECERSSSLP